MCAHIRFSLFALRLQTSCKFLTAIYASLISDSLTVKKLTLGSIFGGGQNLEQNGSGSPLRAAPGHLWPQRRHSQFQAQFPKLGNNDTMSISWEPAKTPSLEPCLASRQWSIVHTLWWLYIIFMLLSPELDRKYWKILKFIDYNGDNCGETEAAVG